MRHGKVNRPSKHSRSSFEPTGKTATGKLSYCAAPNTANANDLSDLSRNSNNTIIISHSHFSFIFTFYCTLCILLTLNTSVTVNSIYELCLVAAQTNGQR